MQLGNTILKIRHSNNLTQEDFAAMFHVTRQTVSNWENEKSYPDLITLVKISDRFNISLDKMLKEDKNLTKKINRDIRLGKWIKLILAASASIVLVLALVWLLIWNSCSSQTEDKFFDGIKKYNITLNEKTGFYTKVIDRDTYFTLPAQSMPGYFDFLTDFSAKQLACKTHIDNKAVDICWVGRDSADGNIIVIADIIRNGSITTLTDAEFDRLKSDDDKINELYEYGCDIYNSLYR